LAATNALAYRDELSIRAKKSFYNFCETEAFSFPQAAQDQEEESGDIHIQNSLFYL
jgi:hypothetical protein